MVVTVHLALRLLPRVRMDSSTPIILIRIWSIKMDNWMMPPSFRDKLGKALFVQQQSELAFIAQHKCPLIFRNLLRPSSTAILYDT